MPEKQRFINTCDAMIHARGRGETFGLACAEFDVCDKPVITYDMSPEKEHLIILGDRARTYNSAESLFMQLMSFDKNKCTLPGVGYAKYTPTYVMQIFEKFLST